MDSIVFPQISEDLKQRVKLLHIFDDSEAKNILFITDDGKVYASGSNDSGKCGFGHNRPIESPQEIEELGGKQVIKFFIGFTFVLALTKNNRVYGWGSNDSGQLGRGYHSEEYLKPEIILLLENIIDISSGLFHSLALNTKGSVFSWGWNESGQVGCGQKSITEISTPTKLKSLKKIKSIYCFNNLSFAVTVDGLVYCWGYNHCWSRKSKEKPIFDPKKIKLLENIISVGFSQDVSSDSPCTMFFLTKGGDIFVFGDIGSISNLYKKRPEILEINLRFKSLKTINYKSCCHRIIAIPVDSEPAVPVICCLESNRVKSKSYRKVFDFCYNEMSISPETVASTERFQEVEEIGFGNFGDVYKCKDMVFGGHFALKKIPLKTDDKNNYGSLMSEVEILSKCDNKYVVKYFDYWITNDILHIQMELFHDNLETVIEQKRLNFERKKTETMKMLEYLISSQILKEILECVKYLHELDPPIIHRDLKPLNILVNLMPNYDRPFKICDFGLATYDSKSKTISHTMWKGTPNYMAPELSSGIDGKNKYSKKADVFSVGKIVCDLFDFDSNLNSSKQNLCQNEDLRTKWIYLDYIIERMTHVKYHRRPNCSEILEEFDLWGINRKDVKDDFLTVREFENVFLYTYLVNKT